MRARAQVSIEFLLIVGFALLLSFPLMYIFYRQSESLNTEIAGTQVDKIASEIRDAADEVYYLGSPSKKTITVFVPEQVTAVTLLGNSIIFNVSSASGKYEVVKWSAANFSGASSISANPGIKRITLEAQTYDILVSDS